jgi:hypothetical protein
MAQDPTLPSSVWADRRKVSLECPLPCDHRALGPRTGSRSRMLWTPDPYPWLPDFPVLATCTGGL